jgi:putative effector of murein hydrolase
MSMTRSTKKSGGRKPTSTFQKKLKTSEKPARNLKKHWSKPNSIKELASQVNIVATMVLNKELDIETARSYSGLVRTIAQAASMEVARGRLSKTVPDLTL